MDVMRWSYAAAGARNAKMEVECHQLQKYHRLHRTSGGTCSGSSCRASGCRMVQLPSSVRNRCKSSSSSNGWRMRVSKTRVNLAVGASIIDSNRNGLRKSKHAVRGDKCTTRAINFSNFGKFHRNDKSNGDGKGDEKREGDKGEGNSGEITSDNRYPFNSAEVRRAYNLIHISSF